jgi:zinc transporter ZupT
MKDLIFMMAVLSGAMLPVGFAMVVGTSSSGGFAMEVHMTVGEGCEVWVIFHRLLFELVFGDAGTLVKQLMQSFGPW